MSRNSPLSIIIKNPASSLGCMGVLCLMVGACAFGSGAVLQGWTGIDFHMTDTIVTLIGGPLIFVTIIFLQILSSRGLADRRIQRAVRTQGRFKSWAELVPLLKAGTGTLIVEVINCGPGVGMNWRVWWTPDDACTLAPGDLFKGSPHVPCGESDFVDWFYERYLDETQGSAFLTDPDVELDNFYPELPNELLAPFRALFPNASLVALPMREPALKRSAGEPTHDEKDRRIRELSKAQGRYRSWEELLPALESGDGTLIVEAQPFGRGIRVHWRVWWTAENAIEISPEKKPANYFDRPQWENRFGEWCYRRYLNPATGAVLTDTPVKRPDAPHGSLSLAAEPFTRLFPKLTVVAIPMRG